MREISWGVRNIDEMNFTFKLIQLSDALQKKTLSMSMLFLLLLTLMLNMCTALKLHGSAFINVVLL